MSAETMSLLKFVQFVQLDQLDQLDQLEQLEQLEQLDQLEQFVLSDPIPPSSYLSNAAKLKIRSYTIRASA